MRRGPRDPGVRGSTGSIADLGNLGTNSRSWNSKIQEQNGHTPAGNFSIRFGRLSSRRAPVWQVHAPTLTVLVGLTGDRRGALNAVQVPPDLSGIPDVESGHGVDHSIPVPATVVTRRQPVLPTVGCGGYGRPRTLPTGVRCTGLRGGLSRPPTVEPDPDHAGAGRRRRCRRLPRLHLITDARPGRRRCAVVAARRLAAAAPAGDPGPGRGRRHRPGRVRAGRCGRSSCAGPYGVLCLVNDRLHVALAVGADGGHVGRRRSAGGGGAPGARAGARARRHRRDAAGRRAAAVAGGRHAISASGRRSRRPQRTVCRTRSGRPGSGRWRGRCRARR